MMTELVLFIAAILMMFALLSSAGMRCNGMARIVLGPDSEATRGQS